MNDSSLLERIRFLIQELERPLVSELKRIQLQEELDVLLSKRKLMFETLAKPNTYMPENIDDSSNVDD